MRRSVTAKIQTDRVKDMIRRRRSARQATQLMDHAVPSAMLFSGTLPAPNDAQKTSVRVAQKHDLSPFIVELKPPEAPAQLIESTQKKLQSANLLADEATLAQITPKTPLHFNREDLRLAKKDVDGQLREEMPASNAANAPLGRTPRKARSKPMQAIASAQPHTQKWRIQDLAPPKPPESLLAQFDFPDEEDPQESDPVEFAQDEVAIRPLATTAPSAHALFSLPVGWPRAIGAFVLLSFVFVLPLQAMQVAQQLRETKIHLASVGSEALAQLQLGTQAALIQDAQAAANSFDSASSHFSTAQHSINELGTTTNLLLSSLPISQQEYRTGTSLIEAGNALSLAGNRLAEGYLAMQHELQPTPVSRLQIMMAYVASALPHLEQAREAVDRVSSSDLPENQRAQLTKLQSHLPILLSSLKEFIEFGEIGQDILGANGKRRYLLVFQNNMELRPTGGFMGSYAEIDIEDGSITRMHVPGGGTYDLQGSLTDFVAAPEPLTLLSARWEFQDANWFPDFPSSARQMLDFYGAAGQPSVDGIIAINATYVADLLALLGPIDMNEYGRTVTSENFIFEAQKIVELEYDKEENRPKAFIGDLAPKVLDRLLEASPETFFSVIQDVSTGFVQRDIQLYFTDEDLQRRILALGWGGDIKATSGDYLMVTHTNLGGGKTDGIISDQIDVHGVIAQDGTITNTVTITRTHDGMQGTLFTGVNNVDFVRVYVPKGSELLSASGFSIPDSTLFDGPNPEWKLDNDVYASQQTETTDPMSGTKTFEETGKTVFGNWIQTRPGTSSTVQFTYRLPFQLDMLSETRNGLLSKLQDVVGVPQTEGYSLTIQKQSGVLDRETTVTLDVPEELQLLWSSHDINHAKFSNDTDAILSALFERI